MGLVRNVQNLTMDDVMRGWNLALFVYQKHMRIDCMQVKAVDYRPAGRYHSAPVTEVKARGV